MCCGQCVDCATAEVVLLEIIVSIEHIGRAQKYLERMKSGTRLLTYQQLSRFCDKVEAVESWQPFAVNEYYPVAFSSGAGF
jgi:hypothetical protein